MLQPGNYSITVEASGFQTGTRDGIKLEATQNARIDFILQVGSTKQTVKVVANASPLNQENAELKTGISPETLKELPLIVSGGPRNMGGIITLVPGVTSPTNDSTDAHMNGGVEYEGEVIVDGVALDASSCCGNGPFSLVYDFPQSPDTIGEVKVLTSNYEPQYGNSAAATIILETKSGTDAFHGALYEYLRNTSLNARQFGTDTRPKDIENDYGGSIGGPVRIPGLRSGRSKPFFFINWEKYDQRGALNRPTLSIPTLQERNGDFRDWVDSNGNLIPIYDPATTRIVSGVVVRDQFMGCGGTTANVICPSDPRLQNSLAKQWFQFLPPPNLPGPQNNYKVPKGTPTLYSNRRFLDFRVDEHLGDKDHISVSASWFSYGSTKFSVLPPQLANEGYCKKCYNWIEHLNWNHTFGPALLNHFGFGYMSSWGYQAQVDAQYANQLPQIAGVPGHPYPPAIGFTDGFVSFGGFPAPFQSFNWSANFIVSDMVTWVQGTHTFKFGCEHRRHVDDWKNKSNESGNFFFARGETGLLGINSGSPIASFLLEQVDSANTTVYGFDGVTHPRQHYSIAHF
jgi:hypothetical protein